MSLPSVFKVCITNEYLYISRDLILCFFLLRGVTGGLRPGGEAALEAAFRWFLTWVLMLMFNKVEVGVRCGFEVSVSWC